VHHHVMLDMAACMQEAKAEACMPSSPGGGGRVSTALVPIPTDLSRQQWCCFNCSSVTGCWQSSSRLFVDLCRVLCGSPPLASQEEVLPGHMVWLMANTTCERTYMARRR
jgi:hypothetical protein